MITRFTPVLLCLLLLATTNSQAQSWRTEPLSPVDQQFMQDQRDRVEELTRRHFGRQFTGQRSNDFPLLQRLLDEKLVAPSDTRSLQAMGVILGDIMKREQFLSWIIYIDGGGRSRALAIAGQREVVYPITMISRRAEVGAEVNVEAVYAKGVAAVERIKKQITVY